MNCPKCGASQPIGSTECGACGVIFRRWQELQDRAVPSYASTPNVQHSETHVPRLYVVAGLILFVMFGIWWVGRTRSARAQAEKHDLINEINNKQVKARARLAAEVEQLRLAQQGSGAPRRSPKRYPPDLDEAGAIRVMESGCSYFRDSVVVEVPKIFQQHLYWYTAKTYPGFGPAIEEHLIELDPPVSPDSVFGGTPNFATVSPTVKVNLVPFARSKVEVREEGDAYHFGLGRRRIQITSATPTEESFLEIGFSWTLEQVAGDALAPEGDDKTGGARLHRTAAGWILVEGWANSNRICR